MTSIWLLIVVISLGYGDCIAKSTCDQKIAISDLDTAVSLIANVNSTFPADSAETLTCQEKMAVHNLTIAVEMIRKTMSTVSGSISCEGNITREINITPRALDCSELFQMGYKTSGVYTIWPEDSITKDKSLKVYCDMETNGGGWTLIQRRGNFQSPVDYFFKGWKNYKQGFGDIEKDFWLGNDNIYALTNQRIYSVRFDLKDVENNTRYAEYSTFRIEDESQQYKLHVTDYTGNAGNAFAVHNKMKFTTKDQENDNRKGVNCADEYKGAWWYNNCHDSNLNGLYLRGKHKSFADGVNWNVWKGQYESLESTEIKIRPKYIKVA